MEKDCLIFKLKGTLYALDVNRVKEIVEFPALTELPSSPPHLKGMFLLRKDLVTVIDVSVAIGGDASTATLGVVMSHKSHLYGLKVDEVQEVATLKFESMTPSPNQYISEVCKRESDLIQYLDCSTLLTKLEAPLKKAA